MASPQAEPGNRADHGGKEIRTFSLAEANRALALVRPIVTEISEAFRRMKPLRAKLEESESAGFGEGPVDVRDEYERCVDRLRALIEELDGVGVQLKDPERGLIDFPALHEGRLILLCWHLGEPGVAYWHELDGGYAGRAPVPDDFDSV
jgi:hypothetical protein